MPLFINLFYLPFFFPSSPHPHSLLLYFVWSKNILTFWFSFEYFTWVILLFIPIFFFFHLRIPFQWTCYFSFKGCSLKESLPAWNFVLLNSHFKSFPKLDKSLWEQKIRSILQISLNCNHHRAGLYLAFSPTVPNTLHGTQMFIKQWLEE